MTNTAPSMVDNENDLLASYRAPPHPGGYDELLDGHGAIRPHWRPLLNGLGALSESDLASRVERLERRVRDTGIAYDIFADPTKASQRWQLDLTPIVISNAEWRWLQTALVQRARIFDALLADLYGEQKLMRDGLLPPDLIFPTAPSCAPVRTFCRTPGNCSSMLPTSRAVPTANGASSTIIPKRWPASASRSPTGLCILTLHPTCSNSATRCASPPTSRTCRAR